MTKFFCSALLALATCTLNANAFACTMKFDGDKLLKQSQRKGLPLKSSCYRQDRAKNAFHAFPTKPCDIEISSSEWLESGWSFTDINGKGRFTKSLDQAVLKIHIEAGGGFKLDSVEVSSDAENCEGATLASVLR